MRQRKREAIAAQVVERFKAERDTYEAEHRPRYTVQFNQWPESVRWTVWDAFPDKKYAVEGYLVPFSIGNEPTAAEAGRAAAEYVLSLEGTDK